MTRRARLRVLGLTSGLTLGLAACSPAPGEAPRLLSVDTRQPAGTVTRIFVDPASLREVGAETAVRYTVLVQTADGREGYPDQPRRIEGTIAFDCRARSYRQLGQVSYGFDGRRQPADPSTPSRGAVEPGSDSALVLDYACASRLRRWWTRYPVVSIH